VLFKAAFLSPVPRSSLHRGAEQFLKKWVRYLIKISNWVARQWRHLAAFTLPHRLASVLLPPRQVRGIS